VLWLLRLLGERAQKWAQASRRGRCSYIDQLDGWQPDGEGMQLALTKDVIQRSDASEIPHLELNICRDAPYPLVVDLDGALLCTNTLDESFASAIFKQPLKTVLAFASLRNGIAAFKDAIANLSNIDASNLPVREGLVEYLNVEYGRGRSLHLATAAHRNIAEGVAGRFEFFESVHASEAGQNLKSATKAALLRQMFPDGFSYAGESKADLAVWRCARSAVIVAAPDRREKQVDAFGVPIERVFAKDPYRARDWAKALRVHQWSKNALVLVPLVLGWNRVMASDWLAAITTMLLLCVLASSTYCINDLADLSADRKHWSKRNRPFASGALPIRAGFLIAVVGIPIALGIGALVSASVFSWLCAYVAATLAYSFGLKRVPLFDTFIIASLFTIRIMLGTVAAALAPSAWLLTFSMFFFFSLAVAKRHTELLRAGQTIRGLIEARGYQVEDKEVTFTLGIVSALASVLIVVIYLVEELFNRGQYGHPQWLWVAPAAVFLWTGRIWLLAHRGLMRDDPVVFALTDRTSVVLGAVLGIAFLLAAW
jgi:4-hydroxybenzoate polyprenyltransferase